MSDIDYTQYSLEDLAEMRRAIDAEKVDPQINVRVGSSDEEMNCLVENPVGAKSIHWESIETSRTAGERRASPPGSVIRAL